MRIFFVFNVKSDYYELYKDTPSVLYNFFKDLYHFKKEELEYGSNLFNQIADKFDKEKMDKKLFLLLHNKMKYTKRKDEHIINNLYKDEVSVMKIKKSYIIINSNKNCTEFFDFLAMEGGNIFACDFINHDYFFVNKLKSLV